MSEVNTKTHTDIKHDHWISAYCPQALQPYLYLARLDRPIGIWLLLIPSLWAIFMASGGVLNMNQSDWVVAGLFTIGAVIMRAAGCAINDLWDKDIDVQVKRTQLRPLASGALSRKQALVFVFFLLLGGLAILLQMGFVTILLGILSVPLIILYPLMKRLTWWPQAFLGVVFNFGVLMGWAAVTGILEIPALLLYASAILWTLGYDTIYAHQDMEDDVLVGIKSTALKFGDNSKKWVQKFYISSWTLLAVSSFLAFEKFYAPIFVLPAFGLLMWQFKNWDEKNPESSLKTFKASRNYGLLVLFGIALAAI